MLVVVDVVVELTSSDVAGALSDSVSGVVVSEPQPAKTSSSATPLNIARKTVTFPQKLFALNPTQRHLIGFA